MERSTFRSIRRWTRLCRSSGFSRTLRAELRRPAAKAALSRAASTTCRLPTANRNRPRLRRFGGKFASVRNSGIIAVCLALAAASLLPAQYARPRLTKNVGIDQKLSSPVPLNIAFRDEAGRVAPLSTYFGDKPVVLSLVYFTCTSLCPMSLRETVSALRRVSLEPGRDYNVVVVSFDPHDTAEAAAKAKAEYRKQFDRPGYDAGFHFLTGDEAAIAKLTSAAGWRYR